MYKYLDRQKMDRIWLQVYLERRYLVVYIPGETGSVSMFTWRYCIWLYIYLERQYLVVYIPG